MNTVAGMLRSQNGSSSDGADELAAERAAREEQQRQEEAAERKRDRDKVLEARTAEKSAKAKASESTLSSGGAGLAGDAAVASAKLKQKLGE
ncbi:hypothetical protein [Pseudodesulfovibrio sp.]|uniref:hypothetical protein n=1 Tax=Pseudodesulfovibrio sp. TaxID=2035812 RepID=UPI00262961A5|nr:hypothetical protein [Pseudodesulfovibrio sp.]MDD3313753.1 hypothetical protein [Pseudodesulfovibrio sp.]